ncbi:Liprin-alpha-4 [Portunus trituberculatus]|uniref:Liprin-alpha-4 n=1 Tax=Portunus trituberculatus TaxID=210409 RepID=A0A5B7GMF5_PORTR|nr:Liprin-alpha-4 [Portunus trituberculatus]
MYQFKYADSLPGYEERQTSEVRLLEEEKQTTEARAEELEKCVGSVEHMMLRGRSLERPSPPISGRSTPKSHHSPSRDYLQKYHTVRRQCCLHFFILLIGT